MPISGPCGEGKGNARRDAQRIYLAFRRIPSCRRLFQGAMYGLAKSPP